MKRPLIGGFVEKQHEIKSPARNGKTTECLAIPLDCHETAKVISYEGALQAHNLGSGLKRFIGIDLHIMYTLT